MKNIYDGITPDDILKSGIETQGPPDDTDRRAQAMLDREPEKPDWHDNYGFKNSEDYWRWRNG